MSSFKTEASVQGQKAQDTGPVSGTEQTAGTGYEGNSKTKQQNMSC